MPTLDELRQHQAEYERAAQSGLRMSARPSPFLAANGKTCRSCQHLVRVSYGKTFYKCGLIRSQWTHGVGTDIRLKDPACDKFEQL